MSMYKNLTATERKSHFRNLVSLAARDGVIRDEENAVLGYVAERIAGGGGIKGALRVPLWGALAQGATALIGHLFGVATA